jgi:hypothetical protein
MYPVPHATLRQSSSTSPGVPEASLPAWASSSLMRSPFASNHAPGAGLNARTCRSTSSALLDQSIRASALSILDA